MLTRLSMFSLLLAGIIVGVILSGRATDHPNIIAGAPVVEAPAADRAAEQAVAPVAAPGPDFTRVAAQTVKAVTNISSVQVVRRSASPFANDPFFQYFFGDQGEMFGRSRAEHPALPVTPDEIADEARRCADAGASIVHIHAQDEDGTWRADLDWYAAAIRALRATAPGILVSLTTIRPESVPVATVNELLTSLAADPATRPDLVDALARHISESLDNISVPVSEESGSFDFAAMAFARVKRQKAGQIMPGW